MLWQSTLQTRIALSTIEAEYIALFQLMRDLIPLQEVIRNIYTKVFEKEFTPRLSTRSKAFF